MIDMNEIKNEPVQDMMNFILEILVDENSDVIYYSPNNITATYVAMERFKEKVKRHKFIFDWFFKV